MIERWCIVELDADGSAQLPPDHQITRSYVFEAGHALALIHFPHQDALEAADVPASKIYPGEHTHRGQDKMRPRLRAKLKQFNLSPATGQSTVDVWDALLGSKGMNFEP